jgi:hypothetical protein
MLPEAKMKHVTRSSMWLVAVCWATLLPLESTARTWNILPDGSGDAPTIQAAIDSCTDGDIVELASGTYTSDGNRDVDFFGKQITVRGATGDAADCVIDCQGSEAENHRGFIFQAGETSESRLESLTITNGYLDSPNPSPSSCGGGILVLNGSSPTLENLTLRSNRAPAGGGVLIMDSEVDLSDCRFLDNQAPWGGGGGISAYYWNPREPISDCLFQGNSTHQAGGGLACSSSELVVRRCQFLENTVDDFGGGFFAHFSTICEFEDCTFAGNSIAEPYDGSGGGLSIWGGSCQLRRCTIVENETRGSGSGIYFETPITLEIMNCIIAFGDVEAVSGWTGGDLIVECTDIYGNEGGDWTGPIAGFAGVTGNLNVDPLFCGNANADSPYTLQDNSPCRPGTYPCLQIGAWGVGCTDASNAMVTPPLATTPIRFSVAPNPFNPQTQIVLELPVQQHVRLGVHDLSGRRLVTLVDDVLDAGPHNVTWNGRNDDQRVLPSGTYIIRLEARAGVVTRKIVMIR